MGRRKLNSDNNMKFRLNRIWASIKDNCNDWTDAEEFIDWSNNNGYKPWKVLDRYDVDDSYSKDNCFWKLSNLVRKLKKVSEDDTPTNVCGYMRSISCGIEMEISSLNVLKNNVDELLNSNNIDNMNNVVQLKRRINWSLEKLTECRELIEGIEIRTEE